MPNTFKRAVFTAGYFPPWKLQNKLLFELFHNTWWRIITWWDVDTAAGSRVMCDLHGCMQSGEAALRPASVWLTGSLNAATAASLLNSDCSHANIWRRWRLGVHWVCAPESLCTVTLSRGNAGRRMQLPALILFFQHHWYWTRRGQVKDPVYPVYLLYVEGYLLTRTFECIDPLTLYSSTCQMNLSLEVRITQTSNFNH